MPGILSQIKTTVYDKCGLEISNFRMETESRPYNACQFVLNAAKTINRDGKITPKKLGQFLTCWKRNNHGPIEPFDKKDQFDFLTVNVQTKTSLGQFVFPKAILLKQGIISTDKKEGKRAFRVYPPWDIPKSNQALKAQKWQLNYFFEIGHTTDFKKVMELYKI